MGGNPATILATSATLLSLWPFTAPSCAPALVRKRAARDVSLWAQAPPLHVGPAPDARAPHAAVTQHKCGRPAVWLLVRGGASGSGVRVAAPASVLVAGMFSACGCPSLGAPAAESSAAEQVRRASPRGRGECGRPRRRLLGRGAWRGVESRRRALCPRASRLLPPVLPASLESPPPDRAATSGRPGSQYP